ncbi:MAG: tetratricopeptide repeat protein [Candidatus Hodarchaeales archaeon]
MRATSEQISFINKYLISTTFGDIEYIDSSDEEIEIIENLKNILDKDSYYLLGGKLFSQIVSQKMALYSHHRQVEYIWQQDFVEIFKDIYEEARETGSEPWEAEVQTAKIIWNSIENGQYSHTAEQLLDTRDSRLTPELDLKFIKRFNLQRNLINIVRNSMDFQKSPSSIYSDNLSNIEKALALYQEGRSNEAHLLFELIFKNLQTLEGNITAISFAILVGSLLILKSSTITKGIYYFQRATKLLDSLDDKSNIGNNLEEMASGYWKIGLYKRSLDVLSTELYIHTIQNNELSVMYTEEKLSNFYRNLSRYIESQEWALHFLNSAVRSTDENLKVAYFLNANMNYAKTLKGLNSWEKAIEHLNFSERTLNHLELSSEIRNPIYLDISRLRGEIAVSRGQFNKAKRIFEEGRELLVTLKTVSPGFSRFLRSEATFFRNQHDFVEGIRILQPLFQEKNRINPKNVSLLAELLTLDSHEDAALKLIQQSEEQLSKWNSIHGLSIIYLIKGKLYLLTGKFEKASEWYHHSLETIGTDLVDLSNYIEAHLSLGYIELEYDNIKTAERHLAFAEEKASMSGSIAYLLDTQFLKANIRFKQGDLNRGSNMLNRIAREARELEIQYIYDKTNYRLNQV